MIPADPVSIQRETMTVGRLIREMLDHLPVEQLAGVLTELSKNLSIGQLTLKSALECLHR